MDVLDDYIDLYKEEGDARIFTLLFNTSNLISPAYAAAIVLGISFGIAALAGLLYYALIGGFDSDGGYGGYSQYSSYLQSKPFNIIFLSFSFYKNIFIVCLSSFSLPINIVILFRTRF